jgi:Galactose oxidase, central domain
MSDLMSFENRFAAAVEHYADQARVDVDPERVTALARAVNERSPLRRVGLGGWHRPDRRLVLLAGTVLLIVALAALAVAGAWRPRLVDRPTPGPIASAVADVVATDTFFKLGPRGDGGWWNAAPLLDGTVLLVGGLDPDVRLVSGPTAILDPGTGVMRPSGPMITPRYDATLTLLQDGRVMVAGGRGREGTLASVEIFDPTSGTFSSAAPMPSPAVIHTATLLADGRVLVVGSVDGAAELYDPRSDSWRIGATPIARGFQTATRLLDDRVLVVGGWGGSQRVSAASEIFDPSTDTFSASGSLALRRNQHAAVLLDDGRVLVVGGMTNPDGFTLDTEVASAEAYDPATGTFQDAGDLRFARAAFDAVGLPSGRVLVIGGDGNAGATSVTELFDPDRSSFTNGPRSDDHTIAAVGLTQGWVVNVTDAGIEVFVPAGAPRPTWAPPG